MNKVTISTKVTALLKYTAMMANADKVLAGSSTHLNFLIYDRDGLLVGVMKLKTKVHKGGIDTIYSVSSPEKGIEDNIFLAFVAAYEAATPMSALLAPLRFEA